MKIFSFKKLVWPVILAQLVLVAPQLESQGTRASAEPPITWVLRGFKTGDQGITNKNITDVLRRCCGQGESIVVEDCPTGQMCEAIVFEESSDKSMFHITSYAFGRTHTLLDSGWQPYGNLAISNPEEVVFNALRWSLTCHKSNYHGVGGNPLSGSSHCRECIERPPVTISIPETSIPTASNSFKKKGK